MKKLRYTLFAILVLLILSVVPLVGVTMAQDTEYVDTCVAESTAEAAMEVPDNSDISFEIILPNPRGDRSFIDSVAAGRNPFEWSFASGRALCRIRFSGAARSLFFIRIYLLKSAICDYC